MHDVLSVIRKYLPKTFLLENVIGLARYEKGEDKSARDLIVDKCRSYGYEVASFVVSSGTFVTMSRNRT
jgi:site-specific DNA-cytosine methylase